MNLKHLPPERFGPLSAWLYRKLAEPALAPFYQAVAVEVERAFAAHRRLPGPARILDLGAGTAALASRLAQTPAQPCVLALDESWPMLARARRRVTGVSPWRLQGRGEALPLAGGSLHLVLSTLALHHWESPETILAEVYRVLAPGGSLWTFEPDPDFSRAALETGLRRLPGPFPPAFLLRRSFRRHGFASAEYMDLVQPLVESSPFAKIHKLRPFLWLRWMILKRPGETQTSRLETVTEDTLRVGAATKPVPGT